MTYEEFEKRLSEYPANFGLKGHPGKIFMISFSGSWANPLVDEDNPEAILLAIDEMVHRNLARGFADMTEKELREQITTHE